MDSQASSRLCHLKQRSTERVLNPWRELSHELRAAKKQEGRLSTIKSGVGLAGAESYPSEPAAPRNSGARYESNSRPEAALRSLPRRGRFISCSKGFPNLTVQCRFRRSETSTPTGPYRPIRLQSVPKVYQREDRTSSPKC